MPNIMNAAFLDFASLGSCVDTTPIDSLLNVTYHRHSNDTNLKKRLHDKQVAMLNKLVLDSSTIKACKNLELIVLAATGTDNVDLKAAKNRGIAVSNIRDYCTASVVQHVMALMLDLTRCIEFCPRPISRKSWQLMETKALEEFPLRELNNKKLGIVGYGNLGRAVAKAGQCFGMDILISERIGTELDTVQKQRMPFQSVLKEADVISLHCPLTSKTCNLIGKEELSLMKSDALLINTARGALVDSQALADALNQGIIAGAGIDVLPTEPPEDEEPLLSTDIPNLIITPHVAWAAKESRQRALVQMAENIADYMNGGNLRRVV